MIIESSKIKLQYMNIAKGIGITLIVLGHSFSDASDSFIRNLVYLFHVPLFFILSGYFFKDEYVNNPGKLIMRRLKILWVPYIKWYIIFVLLHNLFVKINIYDPSIGFHGRGVEIYTSRETIVRIIKILLFRGSEQLLGAFWFIPCMFFTVVLFLAIRWISIKLKRKYLTFLLCSLLFITGNLMHANAIRIPIFPFDLGLYFITTFIYYLGYLYKKFERKIPDRFDLAIVSLLILLVINFLSSIRIDSIYTVTGNFKNAFSFLVFTPILGSYLIICISRRLSQKDRLLFLGKIGEITITILALHFLCFKIVNYLIVATGGMDLNYIASVPVIDGHEEWSVAYIFVGLALPYFLNYLYEKIMSRIGEFQKKS